MRIRTLLKPFSFLPAIFMMVIIFRFSAQEAELSSSISARASVAIVKTADYVLDLELDDWKIQDYASRIHGATRKLAHMTEYFLLAICVSFPLYVYGLHGILLVLTAGIICVAYACGDEYHQSFVAGRAASVKDVGIDSFGVLLGILLVRIIGWTGRHTIFRPASPAPDKKTRREMKALKKEQERMRREMRSQRDASEKREREASYYKDPYVHPDPYSYSDDGYGHSRNVDPRSSFQSGDRTFPGDARQAGHPNDLYEYDENDYSSDELSEDMPLSRLLRRR